MTYNKQNNFQKKHNNKQLEFKDKKNNTYKDNKKSFNKSENYFSKDRDDIYTPKVYPKKKKTHFFDDIILPEYEDSKQRMRNKRAIDQKYKSNRRNNY